VVFGVLTVAAAVDVIFPFRVVLGVMVVAEVGDVV